MEHLAVARAGNLADFLASREEPGRLGLRRRGRRPVALQRRRTTPGRVVLVLGREGAGLRPRVRAACDVLVALPLRGRIESLNVSAAATVLLYEAARRRLGAPSG